MKIPRNYNSTLLGASITITIVIAILSGFFLPGLISWGETIIVSIASLVICYLASVIFVLNKKIILIRYVFLILLALSFIFFYANRRSYVYAVPDPHMGKDSVWVTSTKYVIIGTQLNEKVANKKTQKLNDEKDIPGLFKYLRTSNPEDVWKDYRRIKNLVLLSYMLLVIFLVAVLTHLTEEILLGIKSNQVSDVFISFYHEDKKIATALYDRLKKKKIKTNIYTESSVIGDQVMTYIRKAVKNSRITLALVSRKSILSGYVGVEIIGSIMLEEFSDEKKIFVCKLDETAFDADFLQEASKILNDRLTKLDSIISERIKSKLNYRNITDEKNRLLDLIQKLDLILEKLNQSVYSDLSSNPSEADFDKLISEIKSTLKN
jgi:hypothetical protein